MENKPDPDAILAAIRKQESMEHGGQLRIFFGMSAGVGKTYAMLKAAHSRLEEGVDIAIGIVETHGRKETDALVEGLPIIPKKRIEYRGSIFEEMDLDAILARKPAILLVDELAHTNVPGSRHPKRWQDVLEILDAGISVYTTLNVQHLESRKESIEGITGVAIRETVPDTVLDRASRIELVDLTPEDLLQRLKEGKVYLGENAQLALEHFFKLDRLTALREIALRFTAEKVDSELQWRTSAEQESSNWKATERFMVAVSHSPTSEGLIRATRRLAFGLGAPWIGVNVDSGEILSTEDRATLSRNLSLVRELGGEVVTTADTDIASALIRIATQRKVTQIVFGRPVRRWLVEVFGRGTLLDRLVSESGAYDVLVLRPEGTAPSTRPRKQMLVFESGLSPYWYILWVVAALALINRLFLPFLGYRAVGFIFLLCVLIISLFTSFGPILFAAILSAIVWNLFFIPPVGTFTIREPADVLMFVVFLVVAIITGTLTHGIRKREKMLRFRERHTETLYEIVEALVSSTDLQGSIDSVTKRLASVFDGDFVVLTGDRDGQLELKSALPGSVRLSKEEYGVAKYCFDNGKTAGWSTDTLPSAEFLYIPLVGSAETVGILAYRPKTRKKFLQEEENLLTAVGRELAIAIEREFLRQRTSDARPSKHA
jgi:two-component system sensor histidine kinase KdpD